MILHKNQCRTIIVVKNQVKILDGNNEVIITLKKKMFIQK